jgi:hypothetical protein
MKSYVYLLLEGYIDNYENAHFDVVGCYDSLEKAQLEIRIKDEDVDEYHYYQRDDSYYYQQHGWIIFDVWKITKMEVG